MALKEVAQTLGNLIKVGLYAGSLASPVIGAVVGGVTGGLIGAAIGVFAGPVVAVGALMAVYGVNKLVRFASLPAAERKTALENFDARKATHNTANAFARGLAWAVNLSTFVVTLGRSGTDFDWGQTSYEDKKPAKPPIPPAPAPQTSSSRLPAKPLAESFDSAGDHSQKPTTNVAAPQKTHASNAHKPAR